MHHKRCRSAARLFKPLGLCKLTRTRKHVDTDGDVKNVSHAYSGCNIGGEIMRCGWCAATSGTMVVTGRW